jgi:hypothetical protein
LFFFGWQVLIALALFLFKPFHMHVDMGVTFVVISPHGGTS